MWNYIEKESPKTFKKIGELERKFHRIKYEIPKNVNFLIVDDSLENWKYRFVSENWLLSVSNIDKKWF